MYKHPLPLFFNIEIKTYWKHVRFLKLQKNFIQNHIKQYVKNLTEEMHLNLVIKLQKDRSPNIFGRKHNFISVCQLVSRPRESGQKIIRFTNIGFLDKTVIC